MEAYQNFNIENGVFKGFSNEIRVPDGVKRIAPLSLAPLYQTRCLVLPSTLETFAPSDLRKPYDKATTKGEGSYFMGNTLPRMLEEIRIPVEHPRYQSKNGALYSADGKQLIYQPPCHYRKTVEIADGTEELCEDSCCFVEADRILFPKTLRRIAQGACCACELTRSEIPACEIGESAFQGCKLPEYVEIYNEVIPKKAFANCSHVKGIRLRESVKLLKDEAFSCTHIEKIYIPPVTKIEENAFLLNQMSWVVSKWERQMIKNTNVIIGGKAGSPAEAFAGANGMKFEVVGSSDEEIKAWLGWVERTETDAVNSDDLPF